MSLIKLSLAIAGVIVSLAFVYGFLTDENELCSVAGSSVVKNETSLEDDALVHATSAPSGDTSATCTEKSPWTPLIHSNPAWPLDIVCQKETGHCQRKCIHGRHNEILYSSVALAGLNDRLSIISWLVELAGYLCATAYVLSPAHFLAPAHNQGQPVSPDLSWSDFLNFTFYDDDDDDDAPAIQSLGQEHYQHGNTMNDSDWELLVTPNGQHEQFVDHFEMAVAMTMDGKKFAWKISDNYYAIRERLWDSLEKQSAQPNLGIPTQISYIKETHSSYGKRAKPILLEQTTNYVSRLPVWELAHSEGGCSA